MANANSAGAASDSTVNTSEMADKISSIAERSQKMVQEFFEHQYQDPSIKEAFDPSIISKLYLEYMQNLWSDPVKVMEQQIALWRDFLDLSTHMTQKMLGQESDPVIHPEQGDRRFKHDDWHENPVFDYIKQSYLIASKHILANVSDMDLADSKTQKQIEFYTRQYVDAIAPTNFAATNPKVLRETLDTNGENLLNGLHNLLDDMDARNGQLKVRMTDTEAFELGKNIATTPGKVVFQNDLMQLIQYEPSTETVHKTPLLIMPPWINKYYILDLQPKNSLIKWAVDKGHTVFVMSWVNPDASLAEKGFEDYMFEGPLAALDAMEQATGEKQFKVIGYCIGGTLLSTTLAYMKAKGDDRIKCATFFTTLTDFSDPGDLGVFIDDAQITALEQKMQRDGYLDGKDMAQSFNLLRANDLIWSFVINNYLLGKEPLPFDLLYWNSDSTRMPCKMHSQYLRQMYLHNKLVEKGGMNLGGVDIDLTTIETPAYFISTRDDHIAPWKATYAATQLFKGPLRFVLGGSGHIAGIVNPPVAKKYDYAFGDDSYPATPEEWLETTTLKEGSWWDDWSKWVQKFNGGKRVPARKPGDGKLDIIEDAPGSYVSKRLS